MAIEDLRQRDWILLPGTLCTGEVFTGFLDALGVPAKRRSTHVLTRGRIAAYADSLAARSDGAVLCGFSLGAIVAAHHADRVSAQRILLFGVNPHPDDPAKAPARRELERDVRARGGARALSSRLPPLGGPDHEAARGMILTMAEATAGDIGAQTELALSRPGALVPLSCARCPVLALTGDADTMAPPAQGQAAAEAAPLGRFSALPGLGHYALLEDPALCAVTLTDMEQSLEGSLP